MNVHLPIDLTGLNEFEDLVCSPVFSRSDESPPAEATGLQAIGREGALFLVTQLFLDLARLAENPEARPGFLPEAAAPRLREHCGRYAGRALEALVSSRWLAATDGGWFCARFARENQHLATGDPMLNMRRQGAAGRDFDRRQKMIEKENCYLAELIPATFFDTPNGRMEPPQVRRCLNLIRNVDYALGRPLRTAQQITEGLIQTAYNQVVSRLTDEQMRKGCLRLKAQAGNGNPAFERTTEEIIEKFVDLLS